MAVIFDLDLTLVDSSVAEPHRKARDWPAVYKLIPRFIAYPGIPELLQELHEESTPVCVVTSSPQRYCRKVLAHFCWQVDATVCYHDTRQHKPHPEPILMALQRLGKEPSNKVVAVGDDARDVLAARAAGVLSVAALWGASDPHSLLAAAPDVVCDSVAALRALLRSRLHRTR